jgi:hypothetical protein
MEKKLQSTSNPLYSDHLHILHFRYGLTTTNMHNGASQTTMKKNHKKHWCLPLQILQRPTNPSTLGDFFNQKAITYYCVN